MTIGIRDVAAATGVSIQTVSNVLSNRPGASQQTRARVLDAARSLGYQRNGQAAALRTSRAHRLGLLVVTNEPGFPGDVHQAHLLAGATDALRTAGEGAHLHLLLSWRDEPDQQELVRLTAAALDAVVVLLLLPKASCGPWIEALDRLRLPAVLIEQVVEGERLASVVSDQQQGALDATQHLLRQGHRRIALLTAGHPIGDVQERCLGYNRAMALWGINAKDRQVVETDGTITGGYAATTDLLKQEPRPGAVLAAHDLLALGAMEAARTAGLRVPEDLGVVGFEDLDFAAHLDPALSSVRLPDRALGAAATRLALAYVYEGKFPQHKLVLPTSLHVRGSSVADGRGPQTPGNQLALTSLPAARPGAYRIGVSLISVNNPWRQSMHEQLVVAGEREADVAALLIRDAGADPEQQVRDLRALIADGVDALIVDPGAGEPLVQPVEEAMARDIPVVMLDSAVPTERYTAKVGPDEAMVGKVAAEDLVGRMGPGNIVLLEGPAGWPVVEERNRGMWLVLREHREVRVLATAAVPHWSRARAKEIMRDWLLLFPAINGVLAHDGLMAMGALEAAQEAGRSDGLLLGFVGTYNRALQYLADTGSGKSVLIPTWIGAECLRVALRILRGDAVPKWVDMGLQEITKDNVADWFEPSRSGERFESLVHE